VTREEAEATEWTFKTYDRFISQRFADNEKALHLALSASEKAVEKAENAQQLRNEAQNEFRQSLADLSKLMWTRQEGTEAVLSARRELSIILESLDKRSAVLESGYANIQGRMWAISAIWGVLVLAVSIGVRFIGH
jgi:hypothetical protein